MVTVITADVVGSRREGDVRRLLQERVERLASPCLEWPFAVSRGDEVQGICRGVLPVPELVRRLIYHTRPLSLRIGLGVGPRPADKAFSPWDLNGEAFFRAREALEALAKERRSRIRFLSGHESLDTAANALFALMEAIWSRWTDEQWEAVLAYEREGTYEAAGVRLGIALQNVEKRCRAARWHAIRDGEAALRRLGEMYAALSPERG